MIILPEQALQFGYLEPVGEIAKSTTPKGPKDSALGFQPHRRDAYATLGSATGRTS